MTYPPLRPDRALLTITLSADDDVRARYAALHGVLKQCRLHPLDTTPTSEIVIVDVAAVQARLDDLRAVLSGADMLHLITVEGGRLRVTVIAPPAVMADTLGSRPDSRRPPWLTGE